MSMVMWFNEYSPSVKTSVGGKGASLGEMTGAGLPVPPGFALTTAAFRASKEQAGLDAELAVHLDGLDTNDTNMVSERCSEIRRAIEGMAMPSAVEDDLRSAYATLCSESNTDNVPVAVRSSATSEDSPDASFAGEHDTYLWVRGADDVVDVVANECPETRMVLLHGGGSALLDLFEMGRM